LPPLTVLLPSFAILVLSLSFHEAAHAWTADRLGDPTARQLGRLTLNPLAHIDWIGTVLFPLVAMLSQLPIIGWAKPVPVDARNLREPRRDFAVVALAGPVSNLLLALAAALLRALLNGAHQQPTAVGGQVADVLLTAVLINVLLAVFNMIPVPPLDGGNVAIGLLPAPLAAAMVRLRPFGFLILYALMFSGVLWAIVEPVRNAILTWLL
jgi:Zn-dependent protease